MANGANIVVPVGVQLELNNVQDIISSLQKAMSNVKPDAKGYASIVSELGKAEKRAESLASKLSQGFTTKAGLQSFTKGFEDLIAMVDVVNNKVGQINFDNLTLTADQQAKMNEFTKNIQDAKDAYNAFETDKLKEAVNASQDLQNVFKKLNLNVDTTSLDSAINSIKAKIASLQKEMDAEAKKATTNEVRAASRQSEINELSKLKKLFTSNDLSKTFPEFFKADGNFKNGGKQAFVNLLEQLGIDNNTIELVKKTAGSKIKEIQTEMEKAINSRIKTKESQRNTASDNAKAARDAVERLTAEQKENINSQQELQNVQNNPEMVQARKQETEAIEQENVKIRELIQLITRAFNGGLGKNSNDLKAALDGVRESGGAAAAELENLNQRTKTVENIKRSVSMWMGFNQILRLTRTAIKNVVKDIRDLDKVMTEIAVVTNMSQKDLWSQMNVYQGIAKQYGVATTGVYQVSQIYYQQGLQTSDVMALTNETLKMAKIAGLDYGAAADYMTVAIRGFKMEMTDAQKVVDVYSNLAAKSASDTTELATAMSKTASSAAAVGSSFENTSAMIAMMVETTRESAENIGSALKSIISRYGEMTSDPSKLVDSEGEALSLNKVDKALQSVGISLHDAQGQFRDFDEVILELSSKWDTLDKNSQRYIATVMAGNRQQSRFLALVSDYDRLSELTEEAANSEDAALVQTLKTMDSLETKIQNVKNAFQGFYGNLGLENVFKGALDVITSVINRLNAMPKAFGKIPIAAIGMVANIINVIKTLGTALITATTAKWQQIAEIIKENIARGFKEGTDEGTQYAENGGRGVGTQYNKKKLGITAAGRAVSMVGTGISTAALAIGDNNAEIRGGMEIGGGLLTGIGQGIATGALMGGGVPGAILGGISGIMSALPSLIAGWNDLAHAEELAIKAAKEEAKQAQEDATLKKAEARNLDTAVKKLEELSEARFDSNESYQEWIDYQNQLVDQYPQLLAMYDAEGNAVINTSEAYVLLAQKRQEATKAALDEQKAQLELRKKEAEQINKILNVDKTAKTSGGDKRDQGLQNLQSITAQLNGDDVDFSANLSGGVANFGYDLFSKIFKISPEEEEKLLNDAINLTNLSGRDLKLNLDNFQNVRTEIETYDDENSRYLRQMYGDLIYKNYIEPLSKSSLMQDTEFSSEKIEQKLKDLQDAKNSEGLTDFDVEQQTYEYYMDLLDKMIAKGVEVEELALQIAETDEQLAEINNSFSEIINKRVRTGDKDSAILTKMMGNSLMNYLNQQHMKPYQADLAKGGKQAEKAYNDAEESYVEALKNMYENVGASTWEEIESLLSHPERYTSKSNLLVAIKELFGGEIPETIAKELTGYITDIWGNTNEDLQNNFRKNISNSNVNKNTQIQQSAKDLLTIGNGENGTEIAAQYLNNINKQWSDLVINQKNEAVATQNAKLLADTYVDVGQLSEEANGAMANILSTAELNTREGIQKAIDQIEAYQAANGDLSESDAELLDAILGSLKEHKDNLLLNLNTEFQQYTDSLSDAVKNVNQNYTNNISGFDELKDANEVLQKINSGKIGSEQLTFDETFRFDENLGKYVFTVQGLAEANEAQMKDINSQYEAAEKQLQTRKDWLGELPSQSQGFAKGGEALDNQIKVINESSNYSEDQKVYLIELANSWAASNLKWDKFIESEQEKLEKMGISAEQAKKAAENMAEEAQRRNAIESLDISSIAKGSKTFNEVEQSIINYLTTGLGFIYSSQEAAEHAALNVYNNLKGGGREAADFYKRNLANPEDFQAEVYNEILNQPAEVAGSLLGKIGEGLGETNIQLTQAESDFLASKGLVEQNATSISSSDLAKSYDILMDELQEGLKNGQKTLDDVNKAIIKNQKSNLEKNQEYADALTSTLSSKRIDADALGTLATSLGTTLIENIDFSTNIPGIETSEITGEQFVSDYNAFLNWLQENTKDNLDIDGIKEALTISDKSKITDAAVQAENSIIESIASEINNIKSTGIGKKVNLTYLTNKLGADNLKSIFGDAYQDGILTVTSAVKTNIYDSLKEVRASLKAQGNNTDDLDKILQEYTNTAMSELSEFTGKMILSSDTASVLASRSPIFAKQLKNTGKITINSIEEFVDAATLIYNQVQSQYYDGLADLTKLNSAYANIIKGNLAQQTAGFNMLTSASKIDLTSLQNFLNVYNKKLSDYVDNMGNLTTAGATAGLKSLGNGNYQIADWHKFINQLQITANELSTEYIDAYVSWLESDANVAPNAKEALMTSLVSNMDKLTYAQIGQIAKTFNATVDQILAIIGKEGDNGNGTFNGGNLIKLLNFDKTNEEFARALSTQLQSVTSNMTSAIVAFVEAGADGRRTNLDFSNLKQAVSDFEKEMRALGQNVSVQNLVLTLTQGGEAAAVAAEQIAALSGQELSASDIKTLYFGQVSKLVNAIDTVIAQQGEVIDAVTASLIEQSGGQVDQLGNTGQYVVQKAANLYDAYNNLYDKMVATGEATLADLNRVAALALDYKDGEQIAIDSLSKATNLTYSELGEIFTNSGKVMTKELVQEWTDKKIVKAVGGSNIQITDFQAVAEALELNTDSEEFTSAFKSYNDSLIDMNRQAERNILEEAQNVASAKGGDWINLTQLMDKLNEQFIYDGFEKISFGTTLNNAIQKFGGNIENGILKLSPSANIPAIMQEIAQAAAESGGLLANEMAELADAVADAIKGYADLISGGIEGSLSNEGAQQLQQWASANGIGKLNFIETADGLKVATDQAFELVAALRQVDSMQGKLTFDNLVESLSADKGGRFENISKTTAEIAKIQNQINRNQKDIALARHYGADKDNEQIKALESQNAKLREQLNLYTQIQQRQSIDPSQYNFMDRDIPEVMQGPINYWNSVGKAYTALNETAQTGKMDIQDFTNIVNEMSNLAATSGQKLMFFGQEIDGSAENAAALIQKGYSALSNVDGKGVQIDLSKMGIQFAAGADNAKNNFDKGVQSLADAQIAMLDAAIKVLEVVVAMEQLGDIDVENKGTLDLGEIFADSGIENNGDFTKDFQKWADSIYKQTIDPKDIEHYNEDLAKALDAISIGGTSLKDMIYAASNNIEDAAKAWENLNITEQQYQAVMNAFYQAMLNGDYNLDTIQDSIWDIINNSFPDGTTIEVGDRTIVVAGGTNVVIDWNNEDVQAAEKVFGNEIKDKKQAVTEAFKAYSMGESDSLQVEAVLTAKGIIKTDAEKGGVLINGQHYKSVDSEEAQEAIVKEALKDSGVENIDDKNINIDKNGDNWNVTATGTVSIGDTIINVSYNNGKIKYYSNRTNQYYSSLLDLKAGERQWYRERIQEEEGRNGNTVSDNEIDSILYNIEYIPQVEVNGDLENINIRQKAFELIQNNLKTFKEELENAPTETINGVTTYNVDGVEVKIEGEITDEKLQQAQAELKKKLGVDIFSGAITDAFTADEGALSKAIGEGIMSGMTNWTPAEGETPKIPEIQAEVTSVKITKIGGATYEAGEENVTPPNIDSLNATVNSLKLDASEIDVDSVGEQIQEALEKLEITVPIKTPTPSNGGNSNEQQPENSSSTMTMTVTVNDEASEQINQIQEEASTPTDMPIKADSDGSAANKIKQLNQSAKSPVLKTVNVNANLTTQYKTTIAEATKPEDKTINIKTNGSVGPVGAAGNVALSKGTTGPALAGGRTLMGELGPELVVSKGRYFVVGQNGPEMVSLAPDAIVFNHLQTRQLLSKGKTGTHATPVTNEKKAVSFATGNANGPAMASASEALAALKQLRAMWESLRGASLKDMGGMSGGSGGGGGGGGGNDETKQAVAGVTAEVERWYNWLTKIETTEEHINKLTKEHTLLEKQRISTNQKLNNLQQQYNDLANNRDTRIQLAREQTAYRNQLLNQVGFDANGNPRSALSAFYRAGVNGELLLAQDKAFSDFVAKRGDFSAENKARIAAGKSVAMTVTQQRGITAEEAKKLNAANKKSGKTDYKAGDIVEEALTKKQAKALGLKVGTKLGETITNITLPTSGLALMEELQKRDEFGNLVYNAKSQYDMLQKLGFGSFMTQDSQGNQIDTSTDEGIATAVQNFFDRVDGAKEEIESLTSSINEQEQAALDDAIAMQEINEQIIELYKPISGVTEELEEWYNYLRRINDLQAENNLLIKENELLQSNQTAEGDRIYNNLKQRTELLMQQRIEQEALLKAQQQQTRELQNQVLNDKRLRDFFSSNGESNSLLFNEGVMGQNFQYLSDQQLKKNSLGYYVDEKGQYIDQTGVLRNAKNEVVTNGQFGQVQLDENSVQVKTFNSKGKTLTEIVQELNKQNLDGSFVYGASEAYQILKTMGLGDFMRFDENGNELYANFGELTREEQQNAINTGIKRLQETINNINENVDTQKQTELDILDTDKELIDIKNTLRENAISVENNFKEAIVQERQNAIDTKNELKDALNNAIDKTINGLKDSLEAERKTYDSDKDEKELTALQSQLALLQSSNGSLGKIRDLQNKIRDKQQQMYFVERENAIDELEKSAENQIEALETQIDIMQTALDYQVENGLIWAEINAKLSEWSPEQIASYISQINKDYAKGPTEQEKVMNETLENAQLYKQQQTTPLPTSTNKATTTPQVINKAVTTPQLPAKVTTPAPATTTVAKTTTVNTSQAQQEEKREEKKAFSNIIPVIKDGLRYYTKNKANYKTKAAGVLNTGDSFVVEGLSNKKTYTNKEGETRYMMKAKVGSKSVYVPLWYSYLPENLYDNLVSAGLPRFKKGGSIDFTGPAWVDGSKSEPEQIFNYSQMEQLREIFYENLAMTQVGISGLSSIVDNLPNTNSYSSINNEDYGVNIGQLDFHMEVQEIANDYDARRAGREAMEEMVRIARKTGNRSVSRR